MLTMFNFFFRKTQKAIKSLNILVIYVLYFPRNYIEVYTNVADLPLMKDLIELRSVTASADPGTASYINHDFRFSCSWKEHTMHFIYSKGQVFFNENDIKAILRFCSEKNQNIESIKKLISENNISFCKKNEIELKEVAPSPIENGLNSILSPYVELKNELFSLLMEKSPSILEHPQLIEIIFIISQ